ncbi:MAG: ferritin family protein [Bacteroidetes bacterium]|nr:ferritin family protein [Bacteroidota bacterium]
METSKTLEILKMAILMEKRGNAFYTKIAEQTADPDIKNIFSVMADEEKIHIQFLSEQFASIEKSRSFREQPLPDPGGDAIAGLVLSEEIISKISSAGFEAAAISAAIDMEKKAIEIYSARAGESDNVHEKSLYKWLTDWEKGHLKVLNDLDNELKEKIWFDNNFWPF